MSARHIKCVTFNVNTIIGDWCIVALLHNKPASTAISPGNFCAQGYDERYALYVVNLLSL